MMAISHTLLVVLLLVTLSSRSVNGFVVSSSLSPGFHQAVTSTTTTTTTTTSELYADVVTSSIEDDEETTMMSCRSAVTFLKDEPIESLLPKEDLQEILSELLNDERLIDDSEDLFKRNWDKIESRLRDENRSFRELLGEQNTDSILRAVQKLNEYDPETVQAFLSSDAMSNLFSRVLYDGIFEFFQKIDVFGNIINGLPIIGPIRKQIVTETKRQLDRSLGPLVQNFLSSYTKVAVMEAIDFILSPENRQSFGNANAKLVSSLLDRPVNSLLLTDGMGEKLLKTTFDYVRQVEPDDFEKYIDFVYDYVGSKSIGRAVDVDRIIDSSPTLERTLDRVWTRALDAQNTKS